MKAGTQGFLLFSFAFSYVLSTAEIVIPLRTVDLQLLDSRALPTANHSKRSSKSDEVSENVKREPEVYQNSQLQEQSSKKEFNEGIQSSSGRFLDREDLSKRNRLSFTGMRGKKEFTADHIEPCNDHFEEKNVLPLLEKRSLRNYKELFGGKRAPLAFHGMRGKKSDDYENEWMNSDLFGVRLLPSNQKMLLGSGLFEDGDDIFSFEYPEYTDKKEIPGLDDGTAVKRSPYSFQGMRGKKAAEISFKRAMGFLGMRGKKSPEVWNSDQYKREPQTSFFGMKGKKAQSGFFGMRGKKPALGTSYGAQGSRQFLDQEYQDVPALDKLKEDEMSKARFRRETIRVNNERRKMKDDIKTSSTTDSHFLASFSSD